MNKIPIAQPIIGQEEISEVNKVLKSGMLAMGSKVKEFEDNFSQYLNANHSVAVSNGTVALWLSLKAIGIKKGDEVITTPLSFVATANSILFCGATPVFVDVDPLTYNIDPHKVQEKVSSRTRAILGVHLFGQPFDLKTLVEICNDNDLALIEDAAQAHGAQFNGRKVGTTGIGCFSFYPTKNMVTGEGGMVTVKDEALDYELRLMRNHGDEGKYNHTMLGYNSRMTDMQAALGLVQLKKLDKMNSARIKNAEYYNEYIDVEGMTKPYAGKNLKHVYHQYVLRLEDEFPMTREEFIQYLSSKGVGSAIHYPKTIYEQPLYQQMGYKQGICPVAEKMAHKMVSIPVHPKLSEEETEYVVNVINDSQ
ncbi:MAG: DegT/DnrJ/EryC1/StrS family aminotransferase [Archaeoglobaceae archaeon]